MPGPRPPFGRAPLEIAIGWPLPADLPLLDTADLTEGGRSLALVGMVAFDVAPAEDDSATPMPRFWRGL